MEKLTIGRKGWVPLLALLLLIGAAVGIQFVDIPWRENLGLGYAGLFLATIPTGASLVVTGPGQSLIVSAGRTLDPVFVGLVGGTGLAIGETTSYAVGRYSSRWASITQTRLGKVLHLTQVESQLKRWWLPLIIVLAIVPNPFFDFVGIAAGHFRLSIWKYVGPTFIGKVGRALILAYIGALVLEGT